MELAYIMIIFLFIFVFSLNRRIKKLETDLKEIIGDIYYQEEEKEETIIEEVKSSVEEFKEKYSINDVLDEVMAQSEKINIKKFNYDEIVSEHEIPQKKESSEPTFIDKLIGKVKQYFTEGNLLVRIGGVILFFGIAFLLKYAAEHSTITIETKLILSSIFSIAVIFLGWKFRKREDNYGLILQGIGLAIGYLIIFMSAKVYDIVPMQTAFIAMFGYVIFGSLLAIKQNSYQLAIFAITGGFMSPVILSNGSGDYITLFSYYLLLDLGVFFISFYKSWRSLNLVGFAFTFIIATVWGLTDYSSELFSTVEPFLIGYYIIYLSIAILTALKGRMNIKGYVDSTLVFGLPLIAFPLQLELVKHFEYGAGISALVLGIVYSILFYIFKNKKDLEIFSLSLLSIGILFLTISIPYFFNDKLTGAIWAMESIGILWTSFKQNKTFSRYFGEILLFIGTIKYIFSTTVYFNLRDVVENTMFLLNTVYLGYFIITVSLFSSAYLLYKNKSQDFEKVVSLIFIGLGSIVWIIGGNNELLKLDFIIEQTMSIYITLFTILISIISRKINWITLEKFTQLYLFINSAIILASIQNSSHLFESIGSLSLGIFFITNYYLLSVSKSWIKKDLMYLSSLFIFTGIITSELSYQVTLLTTNFVYEFISYSVPSIVLSILLLKDKLPFYFKEFKDISKSYGSGGLILFISLLGIVSLSMNGNPEPLKYIPILNPLEIMFIFISGLSSYWLYLYKDEKMYKYIIGVSAFILFTIAYTRGIHFYTGVNYNIESMFDDNFFQTGLSILWSLMGISIMLMAKKYSNRMVWMTGFGLLSLVVVKLFFVELSHTGTIERIVSFMVVGTLLLLIGYFAPIPPKKEEKIEN